MKTFNKHEFDEIFRTGLSAPDLSEVDEDWALMKARLEKDDRKNKLPYYFVFVTSVAAVLLLVFSLTFNSSEPTEVEANNVSENDAQTSAEVPRENVTEVPQVPLVQKSKISGPDILENSGNLTFSQISPEPANYAPSSNVSSNEDSESLIAKTSEPIEMDSPSSSVLASNVPETTINESALTAANVADKENETSSSDARPVDNKEQTGPKSNSSKSRFSLALSVSPNLSGVEQFQNNHVNYSIVAGAIYNISNKLIVEAGAAYGKKTYQTGFSSFRPASYNLFQVKPNAVRSGFDVMDLQLNLAYTLLNKGKSTVGMGAGISSYLMLDEQYSFTYQNMNARGLSSFSTGYQNNHFFGIANLFLTYKRNLSNNVKLAFNPYLKLPLTDLGYGNIRLRSAGMSVGIITNLNKSKR